MDKIFDAFNQWIKDLLVGGIMNNLSGLFDNVNTKVQEISTQVLQPSMRKLLDILDIIE